MMARKQVTEIDEAPLTKMAYAANFFLDAKRSSERYARAHVGGGNPADEQDRIVPFLLPILREGLSGSDDPLAFIMISANYWKGRSIGFVHQPSFGPPGIALSGDDRAFSLE
ncbi:MAG: hypothetical protein JOZ60_04890 [Verrucomicrobia bacterium]|nr:hypothetical protein [Verrucomicrobiota bacterium]